jgi:3-deoxy-D-manno-octulosonate 8-phosphate phosphatase (KDO 8-P phosphatase)
MSTSDCPNYFLEPGAQVRARAAAIRLVALDVDGVLTDGHVYMGNSGELMKAFHIQDGKGISMLLESGLDVALITARSSGIVEQRGRELGIRYVLQGQKEKWPALEELTQLLGLGLESVAYAGDDLLDVPLLCRVGLGVAVANAHPWVARHSHWQTQRCGGQGAVRELCELILDAQDKLQPMLERYVP